MVMLPLLKYCANDPKEHRRDELINEIIKQYKLTEEERKQLLPSGKQEIIDNRVGWACSHLKIAGLLEYPKRGYIKITQPGIDLVGKNPPEVNVKLLNQFEKYSNYTINRKNKIKDAIEEEAEKTPPLELIETGVEILNNELAESLLEKINSNSHTFAETIIIDDTIQYRRFTGKDI
jgi:restriction system protein